MENKFNKLQLKSESELEFSGMGRRGPRISGRTKAWRTFMRALKDSGRCCPVHRLSDFREKLFLAGSLAVSAVGSRE